MDDWDGFDDPSLAAALAAADARAAERASARARAASGGGAGPAPAPAPAPMQCVAPPPAAAPRPPAASAPPPVATGVFATGVFASEGGVQQHGAPPPPPPRPVAAPLFQHPPPPPSHHHPGPSSGAAATPHPPPPQQHPFLLTARFVVAPAGPGPPAVEVHAAFHPAVQAALRGAGGVWSPDSRAWRLPPARAAEAAAALRSAAASSGLRLQIDPLPDVALRILACAASAPDDSHLYQSLPPRLEAALMPFQREGVKFGLRHGGRALVGDEMGLGKTVQAIALMSAYRSEWPALIICPSSLREAWAAALAEWLGAGADRVVVVSSAKDGAGIGASAAPTYDFVIVSYALVGKLKGPLEKGRFRVITMDESHYIKDGRAQRTKDTLPLTARAARVFLLSGTPALARPKELVTQLGALFPGARLRGLREFGERYCQGGGGGGPRQFGQYDGASNLEELFRLMTAAAMIRRLKADVLTQLPPKRRQQVFLALDGPDKKELAALGAGLDRARAAFAAAHAASAASGGDAATLLRGEERRAIMDAYHRTAVIKAGAVQRYVEDLLAAGSDKFIIFAHHTELLDAICFTLTRSRTRFMRIDGGVATSKRQGLVDEFQSDGGVRAAVLSISAAGVGLTLTGASVVVFAEMSWTPGAMIQAEDRAHRIGQARAVNVYYLHLRGSVDDIIWNTLQNKLEAVGGALDGKGGELAVAAAPVRRVDPGQATLPGMMLARSGRGTGGGGGGGSARQLTPPPPAAATGPTPGPYDDDDGCSSPVHPAGGGGVVVAPPAPGHLPPPPPFSRTQGPMDRFVAAGSQQRAAAAAAANENAVPGGGGDGGGGVKRARVG